MSTSPRLRCLVTCEHASNRVPAGYRADFVGREKMLASHRAWDPGAARLARDLARALRAPLHEGRATRLLVDLNRSSWSEELIWRGVRAQEPNARARLIERHYLPYRRAVERHAARLCARAPLLHLSVHTFTPVRRGVRRAVDIGVLFDPGRELEAEWSKRMLAAIGLALPRLRARANEPYKGVDDGLTTHLRGLLPRSLYAGIELEVNQRLVRAGPERWTRVRRALVACLAGVLTGTRAEMGVHKKGVSDP